MPTLLRLILTSSVSAALIAASTTAAQAGSRSTKDPTGDVDGARIELTSVSVKNTRSVLTIQMNEKVQGAYGTHQVWIDTNKRRKGPEFLAYVVDFSDQAGLVPVNNWTPQWDTATWFDDGKCANELKVLSGAWEKKPVVFRIKKRAGCLGTPKKVRIAANAVSQQYAGEVTDGYTGDFLEVTDHLNSNRSFTKWVKARSAKKKATTFRDRRAGATSWNDITSASVSNASSQVAVTVRHGKQPENQSGMWGVWLDTNSATKGPDFYYQASWAGGGSYLWPTAGWSISGNELPGACVSDTFHDLGSSSTVKIASTCLNSPRSLRIATSMTDTTYTPYAHTDWLGKPRKLTKWVKRN